MKKLTYLKLPKTVKKYKQWTDDIANGTYRSYLTVRDVNKVGRRHWMFCDKQNREVHLLSDGERRMYMELLYKPSTVAVFEQYALDLDETLDIAIELNIMHPRNWKTYEAYVMSTDFLVESLSADDNTTQLTAYTFKYWDQIYKLSWLDEVEYKSMRTWQKFAIEREFWRRRGIEYRVVTERDATKVHYHNKLFSESAKDLKVSNETLTAFLACFCESWQRAPWCPLQALIAQVSHTLSMSVGDARQLFKFSLLYGFLPVYEECETHMVRWFRPVHLMQDELGIAA
ncbi:TnsA endonuclease N-terminal domain-containing protein [Alteromonas sp. 1_MG-2023]|uniref:TnsA endonuclease N-terminal domain-containing protein n=1 Tax=Alteromonas sp. 1_MG-2023 TaxID=3062669 RepID=UPI0026E2EDD1|nr:TnsA endonuclease N-terminal domain-containing protein [Alteromonas sp. 1_MG-2023]MDO6568609.1 TnsA endonuclease N-terminal domain-containing protein [Alteromonas sp. 1_MG-2023]